MTNNPSLFVPLTVMFELEWVLRAFYRFDAPQIVSVFEHLLGLGHINTEESERIAAALPLTTAGMDFADALHLAGSDHCGPSTPLMIDASPAARDGSCARRQCECRQMRHRSPPATAEHDRVSEAPIPSVVLRNYLGRSRQHGGQDRELEGSVARPEW